MHVLKQNEADSSFWCFLFAVKQRIRAIKNIGKITKAMKMVAASKMRNAQAAVETSRGIVDPFIRLFGDHPGAPSRWKSITSMY